MLRWRARRRYAMKQPLLPWSRDCCCCCWKKKDFSAFKVLFSRAAYLELISKTLEEEKNCFSLSLRQSFSPTNMNSGNMVSKFKIGEKGLKSGCCWLLSVLLEPVTLISERAVKRGGRIGSVSQASFDVPDCVRVSFQIRKRNKFRTVNNFLECRSEKTKYFINKP